MTTGPSAWGPELEPLADELIAVLDVWLPRLRAAFGAWSRPQGSDPAGEPDGYGGLAGRGPWERLLMTEWALAREVPDEFVRRAAMREQLYLRLERVLPAPAPHTRVWVDCGPTQLGAPRLAHLAVLHVLRRRAVNAGGQLSWAPAHQPDAWRDGVDAEDLFRCRTLAPPADHLPRLDGEVFAVGGPALPGRLRRVVVAERDGGLAVRVGPLEVRLELPDPQVCARLVERPSAQRARPRVARATTGRPVDALTFVPGGGALILRIGERVVAWAVPSYPRERPKSRWADPWYPGQDAADPVVAVGWNRRALVLLRASAAELVLLLKGSTFRMGRPAGFEPPASDVLPRLAVLPANACIASI